ncbi:NAD-dependent epimerase/dehydratase family protein [uncultured Jatrophihabitans sp.]|uniref:NAD-dependent epimerase/dehydratase family protein n=1 Tax=uncultured Jatrophihabitans sp. TaxID=1610747 RepID=UPI0035CBA681
MTAASPGTVLLTGAAGSIGSALREGLPSLGWAVLPLDREPVPGGMVAELADTAALDRALTGEPRPTAVVHLAGVPSEAPWPVIRDANVDGLVQVFEAARRAGVRRVVYASSNHVSGFTPVPSPDAVPLPADLAPRPDTLYGVSKAFGEALGRYYADRYGMQVACLRIGNFTERPDDRRTLAMWLSPGDAVRLVDACLRASALTFAIVWGISANTRRTCDLAAGRALGYEPRDDSEAYAHSLDEPQPDPSDGLLGGGFTSPGFGIDEVAARS